MKSRNQNIFKMFRHRSGITVNAQTMKEIIAQAYAQDGSPTDKVAYAVRYGMSYAMVTQEGEALRADIPWIVIKFPGSPSISRTLKKEYQTGNRDKITHLPFPKSVDNKLRALAATAKNALDEVSSDIFGGCRAVHGDINRVNEILTDLNVRYAEEAEAMKKEIPIAQASLDKFIERHKDQIINAKADTIDEQYIKGRIKLTAYWLNPGTMDKALAEAEMSKTRRAMMETFIDEFAKANDELGKSLGSAQSQAEKKGRNPHSGTIENIKKSHSKLKSLAKHVKPEAIGDLETLDPMINEISTAKARTDEDKKAGLPTLVDAINKTIEGTASIDVEIEDDIDATPEEIPEEVDLDIPGDDDDDEIIVDVDNEDENEDSDLDSILEDAEDISDLEV